MAVFTHVRPEELDEFLTPYRVGPVHSFKGIAEGVENSNYLVKTEHRSYILTLYEKRVLKTDLPFFLGLMDHLADKGLPSARPLSNDLGIMLGELCGRPAALIEFLEGVSAEPPSTTAGFNTGRAMAEMHLAGADFNMSRANDLGPDAWRRMFDGIAPKLDPIDPELKSLLSRHLDEVLASWTPDLPGGVIHADLFPDNVLLMDDEVSGIIDFYFACNDAFAYDLAVMINAWCFEDGKFNFELSRAIVQGYQSIRPLTTKEIVSLPILARGAAIRFILTRAIDWVNHQPGALVRPKDPRALLPNLVFHGQASSPALYGV